MLTFKPERMKWNEIREKAEDFRTKYVSPPDMIPVPIEDIVEFELGISPWPINGLLQKIDIDGFLSNDFNIYSLIVEFIWIKDGKIGFDSLLHMKLDI